MTVHRFGYFHYIRWRWTLTVDLDWVPNAKNWASIASPNKSRTWRASNRTPVDLPCCRKTTTKRTKMMKKYRQDIISASKTNRKHSFIRTKLKLKDRSVKLSKAVPSLTDVFRVKVKKMSWFWKDVDSWRNVQLSLRKKTVVWGNRLRKKDSWPKEWKYWNANC